jgi:hypothetical protein
MQEAYRWLMEASPKQAESLVVYPGVGTKEEHMDDRAVGSICRNELTDRDSASQYLSATARELDKILGQTRDPARRTKATALDVQVYMGRGRKWRVSIEYPLAAVFAISGYPEHVLEIVEGRFWGIRGEAYWARMEDGTIVTAEFSHRDDLGYVHFVLKSSLGRRRDFQAEYPLIKAMNDIEPERGKWFRGHSPE